MLFLDVEEELLEDIYVKIDKIDKKESIIKEERFRKLLEVFKDFDSIFGKVLFLNCFSIFFCFWVLSIKRYISKCVCLVLIL